MARGVGFTLGLATTVPPPATRPGNQHHRTPFAMTQAVNYILGRESQRNYFGTI